MINANALRGKIAEAGMNQKQVAQLIGMSEKTFSMKINNGKFRLDEAEKLIELLGIENPERVFFPNIKRGA